MGESWLGHVGQCSFVLGEGAAKRFQEVLLSVVLETGVVPHDGETQGEKSRTQTEYSGIWWLRHLRKAGKFSRQF